MATSKSEPDTKNGEYPDFLPIRLVEIELSLPLQEIDSIDPMTGRFYQRCQAFVYLHHHPLGMVELEIANRPLAPDFVAEQIWDVLSWPINQHLRKDGIGPISTLDGNGISATGRPACMCKVDDDLANPPLVSVVICTRDHPESLAVCLDSLRSLEYPMVEIVVVDNAPATNATFELIEKRFSDLKNLRYIREDRPGLSAARNSGIAKASGEIIAFTDDDVKVDSQWLNRLVQGFSLCENVACVTGLVLPAQLETPAQEMMEQFGGMGKGFVQQVFDLKENRIHQPQYPYSAGWFGVGANMAYKTSILRRLGGFDPALGTGTLACGGEDLAMFFNIVAHGYRLVYQPCAIIHHYHRQTYEAFRKQVYCYGVGLTAYLSKVVWDRPARLLNIIVKVPAGIRYLINKESAKNRAKRANYPAEINWLERKGMLYGPLAYWKSYRQAKKYENRKISPQSTTMGLPAREEASHQ